MLLLKNQKFWQYHCTWPNRLEQGRATHVSRRKICRSTTPVLLPLAVPCLVLNSEKTSLSAFLMVYFFLVNQYEYTFYSLLKNWLSLNILYSTQTSWLWQNFRPTLQLIKFVRNSLTALQNRTEVSKFVSNVCVSHSKQNSPFFSSS